MPKAWSHTHVSYALCRVQLRARERYVVIICANVVLHDPSALARSVATLGGLLACGVQSHVLLPDGSAGSGRAGGKLRERVAEFRSFVRPVEHPTVTELCRRLTGVAQEDVDAAPELRDVLPAVDAFLRARHGDAVQVTVGGSDARVTQPAPTRTIVADAASTATEGGAGELSSACTAR